MGEVLLPVQGRWPRDTRIPAVGLAHQSTLQTRLQAVGAGILAMCSPSLGRHLPPRTLYRLWLHLMEAKLSPLTATNKMGFARAMGCHKRLLPAARQGDTVIRPRWRKHERVFRRTLSGREHAHDASCAR